MEDVSKIQLQRDLLTKFWYHYTPLTFPKRTPRGFEFGVKVGYSSKKTLPRRTFFLCTRRAPHRGTWLHHRCQQKCFRGYLLQWSKRKSTHFAESSYKFWLRTRMHRHIGGFSKIALMKSELYCGTRSSPTNKKSFILDRSEPCIALIKIIVCLWKYVY